MPTAKMKQMRSMMTDKERTLKGLDPWKCRAWRKQKIKKRNKLKAQMEAGHERREAKRLARKERHEAMLKQHAEAKKSKA